MNKLYGSDADVYARASRRLALVGFAAIALFGGGAAVWATSTAWSGAVVAVGQLVVETNVKKVQHATGGPVGRLAVREGQFVKEGDLLIRLDDSLTRANLQIVSRQMDQLIARAARLDAEREDAPAVTPPAEFAGRMNDPDVARLLAAETALFVARRKAREGQRLQLAQRIEQSRNEVVGLLAQQTSLEAQAALIIDELTGVRELYRAKLVPITRLNALEREAAALEGQKGHAIAAMAQTENRIAETQLQILQIDTELVAETMKELRQIEGELAGLAERRAAAEDQLRRVDITAPSTGYVHQLAVHSLGGVVSAGEPAMLIVPSTERLQVEARVAPHDVDQVHQGQEARLRLHAFNQRTTPEIVATIVRVAADIDKDRQTGAPYYNVRLSVAPEEAEKVGAGRLIAGMQADVFIKTSDRTPLDYLLQPIRDQFAKAFRER